MKETLDDNPEYPSISSGDSENIGLGISPLGIGLVKTLVEVEDSAKVKHVSFLEVVGTVL